MYQAMDAAGNLAQCIQTIVVQDTLAPVPNQAALPTVTGQCAATVANVPTATDNCAGTVTGTTTDPLTYTSQGTFTITWTYNDGHGNSSSQTQTVIVKDTTPPTLTVSLSPTLLWPANPSALYGMSFTFYAADTCSPPVAKHVSVYSDEPNGGGDATYSTSGFLTLRARRNASSDGRVYLIVVTATDAAGNSTFQCKTVVVPKSNSSGWVDNVNTQAAAAVASCTATGSPLTPYVIVP
jgi:hypothetical protein